MCVIQVNIYVTLRKIEAIGRVKDTPKSGSPKTSRSDKMWARALKHAARLSLKNKAHTIKDSYFFIICA